ncbi:MAG: hypothetical protein RLZZ58_800 [Pseudomonadota bacterium]
MIGQVNPFGSVWRRDVLRSAALFPVAAALGAAPASAAQSDDWGDDIALLRQVYESLHPGLYRYNSPREMARRFSATQAEWTKGPTRRAAFLSLSRLLASVRCGHSYANFYNQSAAVQAELLDDIPRLPFLFRWIDRTMVVARSQGDEAPLPPGTRIERINGVATADILRQLLPLVRADGHNEAKQRSLLSCLGTDTWETFDVLYGNMWPNARTFDLHLRYPDNRRARVTRGSISHIVRQADLTASTAGTPLWPFAIGEDGTATLTMPGWALYNSDWDWNAYLADCFGQMAAQRVARLIIDLRGNEGGLDCGDAIIARLIDAPLVPESYERRVRFDRVPAAMLPYLDTWDRSFDALGVDARPIAGGFRALPAGAVERIEPVGPRFAGKVAVIVDASNSSATWRFASIMQAYGLGTLVGETTGGNRRGINGGAFYFLRLPKSGLEADVPLIGAFPRTPKPDGGLDPDVFVAPTAADIAAGYDRVMATARRALAG